MVIFSVDGLDVLYGKPASADSNGYVVNAYSKIEVPGWRINDKNVAKFTFRVKNSNNSKSKTYVEELLKAGFVVDETNQGVIGCMVIQERYNVSPYRSYSYGMPVNLNYSDMTSTNPDLMSFSSILSSSASASNVNSAQASSLGTGFGETHAYNVSSTYFNREDNPVWIGVFKYDSLVNLKKMGVVVDRPKTPINQAFPNYRNDGCYVPR